jgi:hypothetical protein
MEKTKFLWINKLERLFLADILKDFLRKSKVVMLFPGMKLTRFFFNRVLFRFSEKVPQLFHDLQDRGGR